MAALTKRKKEHKGPTKGSSGRRGDKESGFCAGAIVERLAILVGASCGLLMGFGPKSWDSTVSETFTFDAAQIQASQAGGMRTNDVNTAWNVTSQSDLNPAVPPPPPLSPHLVRTPFVARPFDCATQTSDSVVQKNINLPFVHRLMFDMALDATDLDVELSQYGKTEIYGVGIVHDIIFMDTPSIGTVFLDIGAHMGWFTAVASHWGAQVYAFELDAPYSRVICKTVEMNKDAWVKNTPVIYNSVLHDGGSNTLDGFAIAKQWIDNAGVRMETAPQDVIVMKVDVDGGEPSVLRGGKAFLNSGLVKHLLLLVSVAVEAPDRAAMGRLLREAGFTVYRQGLFKGPRKPPNTPDPENYLASINRDRHVWLKHSSASHW